MDMSGKRMKTSIGEGEEIEKDEAAAEKKMPRVWSEEDEIVLLQGMIDHINVTGKCPMKDVDGFLQSISIDLTLREFRDKFRSIHIKTRARMSKEEEPTFDSPHDRKVFDLCSSILSMYSGGKLECEESKEFGARMIRARERAAERARERASRKPTRKSARLEPKRIAKDGNKEA